MKLAIGLCIAVLGAPLEALGEEAFGSRGTLLPKGAVSVAYQRFNLNSTPVTNTWFALTPELGYFLLDHLVLFTSVRFSGAVFAGPGPNTAFFGVGGGLGLGYHFEITESVGLLPQLDGTINHSFGSGGTVGSTGFMARARIPLIITHENVYFGVGPEAHWYAPLTETGGNGSFLVGLFTEIGAWF